MRERDDRGRKDHRRKQREKKTKKKDGGGENKGVLGFQEPKTSILLKYRWVFKNHSIRNPFPILLMKG